MANRIAIGRRASGSSDRGLMVSGLNTSTGSGTTSSPYGRADVTSSSSVHNFDSQAHVGGGMHVFYYAQNILNDGSGTDQTSTIITHNWGTRTGAASGDRPLYALRWSYPKDIVNGVAVRCYKPGIYESIYTETVDEEESGDEEEISWEVNEGVEAEHVDSNSIRIYNKMRGAGSASENNHPGHAIYWALVVFWEDDYNGGNSI